MMECLGCLDKVAAVRLATDGKAERAVAAVVVVVAAAAVAAAGAVAANAAAAVVVHAVAWQVDQVAGGGVTVAETGWV